MNKQQLYKSSEHGSYGGFEIEILVGAHPTLPDLNSDAIRGAAYDAVKNIKAEVMAAVVAKNPDAQERRRLERAGLLSVFDCPIYVEEIPNGYCSDWCCRHLPWFVVTTRVGRIKIGWRKRVINIDWSETVGTKTSEELFKDENVTKWDRAIHAWSLDYARRYIEAIIVSKVEPVDQGRSS